MRRRDPSRSPRTAGFTLLEMLVIVMIVGIMAVIAVPLTMRQLVRIRIESFADQAVSLLQSTRGRAIKDNTDYVSEWVDDAGDTVLDALSGITGLGGGTSQAVTLSLPERGLTVYDDAPCLAETTDGKAHVAGPLTYDGKGVADQLVAFCFQDPNGNILQVAIDTPAGAPKVRKYMPLAAKFSPEVWQWEWY